MPPILNASLKAELEQTRARLLNEQNEIVQAISQQAEAEIDRLLGYINSLLEASQPSSTQSSQSAPESEPKASPARSDNKSGAKSKASSQSSQAAFDAAILKAKFKGSKPIDAIVQILADEKHPLSIDDLINQLYDSFDQADISKARRSVAITTKHAERRGLVRKAQDNPPQFEAI